MSLSLTSRFTSLRWRTTTPLATWLALLGVVLATGLAAPDVAAQSAAAGAAPAPRTADPSKAAPGPDGESVLAPAVTTAPVVQDKPQADPRFDILEFQVEGNTVLPELDIERAVYPFLGEKKQFSDVEGARKALEETYQKRGYQTVFVDIPEQKVAGGVIRLNVLEGKVGRERVTGSRYFELGEIRTKMAQFAPGTVPDFNAVQDELARVNRLPDAQVAPILTPGRVPGTVDVELSVKDQPPLHGEVEIDNHASPFTTRARASASVHYDNLWQRQHSVALNYQIAPEKPSETNVLYGTYLWRFAGLDDALSFYAIRSNSNVAVVGSSTILGNARIFGARWIRPLGNGSLGAPGSGAGYFNALTFGIDRKDFGQTNISAQTGAADPLPGITYVPLSLSYGLTLSRPDSTSQFSLGVGSAPRGILGNKDAPFQGRRVVGAASYVAWKYDLSHEQWAGQHFSAYAHLDGQWTTDPLINNEQFAAGGADSVRGYRESEVSGDRGVHGTLEARYYPRGRPAPDGRRSIYVLLFADGARVQLVDPQGPQVASSKLLSGGLGLRAQGRTGMFAALDVAEVFHDGGRGVSGAITRNGLRRIDASLGYRF